VHQVCDKDYLSDVSRSILLKEWYLSPAWAKSFVKLIFRRPTSPFSSYIRGLPASATSFRHTNGQTVRLIVNGATELAILHRPIPLVIVDRYYRPVSPQVERNWLRDDAFEYRRKRMCDPVANLSAKTQFREQYWRGKKLLLYFCEESYPDFCSAPSFPPASAGTYLQAKFLLDPEGRSPVLIHR